MQQLQKIPIQESSRQASKSVIPQAVPSKSESSGSPSLEDVMGLLAKARGAMTEEAMPSERQKTSKNRSREEEEQIFIRCWSRRGQRAAAATLNC